VTAGRGISLVELQRHPSEAAWRCKLVEDGTGQGDVEDVRAAVDPFASMLTTGSNDVMPNAMPTTRVDRSAAASEPPERLARSSRMPRSFAGSVESSA
jgi:hypothetical protein